MLPIGFYSFRNQVQAYRSDFCAACGTEVLAQKVQGFLWLSLFAIPVLPLGRRAHWTCLTCGRPPQAFFRLPAAFLALLGFALALYVTVSMFVGEPVDDNVYYLWEARLLFGAFALFMGLLAVKYLRIPNRKERLQHLTPCSREICALCGGALDHATPQSCRACGVMREEILPR